MLNIALLLLCFVDAGRAGVIADGRTDNYDVLQRVVDMGGTVDLPSGIILTRYPIYVDKDNTNIRGQGKGVTIVRPQYGQTPPFIFGVRRKEVNNGVITNKNMVDCYDILDRTIAPIKNNYFGFSNQASSYIMAVANPLQYGRISPTSGRRVFDGYGSLKEMTVEFALRFNKGIPKNATILGLGHPQNPGPWIVATDAESNLIFLFRAKDYDPVQYVRVKLTEKDGLQKFRIVFKNDITIYRDGQLLPVLNKSVTNASLARNLGSYPFFIGPGNGPTIGGLDLAQVADMDIFALKVSIIAKTDEPDNDYQRYGLDANTLFCMSGRSFRSRTVDFNCGISTSIPTCVGFINSTTGTYGGIKNNTISDLTINGGGILIGQVLDFKAQNVESINAFVGLGSFPIQMNYPITIENCNINGYHAGVVLTRAFAWLRNVNVEGAGMASMIFIGCNVSIDNALFSFFSPEAETCILSLPDEAGGRLLLRNIEVDNEDFVLPSAVKVHLAPYGPITYVDVNSLGMASLNPDRPIIDLVGTSTKPGMFKFSGLVGPINALPVIAGPGWSQIMEQK